jgi:hypothetical protein
VSYAICFDFPETSGDPLFAKRLSDALGWTMNLSAATRFATVDEAQRTLENGYSANVAEYGRVVEVSA